MLFRSLDVVLGAETVAWLRVNRDEVAVVSGEARTVSVAVSPGQFPIELRFAQLWQGESALRFRIASGDVQLCYPDFGG